MKEKTNRHIPGRTWLIAVIMLVVSSNSCGIFDECDATLMPLYYVDIRAEITVTDNSGPCPGVPVRVEMQKKHCGGKLGPNLVSEGVTAANGIYTSPGSWSFKMSNQDDDITIRYGFESNIKTESFTYESLSSYSGGTFVFARTIVRP